MQNLASLFSNWQACWDVIVKQFATLPTRIDRQRYITLVKAGPTLV